MARRATAIKQELEKNDGLVLILDAGSTLVGAWEASKSLGQVVVESMSLMGYDAMTVGRMDLAIGDEAIAERQAEASFPFLSANIVRADDDALLFQPYVILERKDRRIGIIGLSEAEAVAVPLLKVRAKVLDPVEVAQALVPSLRQEVDLLIVLSHLGLEADGQLAAAVPGIDIIVGGNTRQLMRQPERVGNTLIIQQGYRGEWLGVLRATFDAEGVPTESVAELITLTDAYADDPQLAAVVEKYKELYPQPTPVPTPEDTATPAAEEQGEGANPTPTAKPAT